jgi:hypothetical protein
MAATRVTGDKMEDKIPEDADEDPKVATKEKAGKQKEAEEAKKKAELEAKKKQEEK